MKFNILVTIFVMSLAESMGSECGTVPITEWSSKGELNRKETLPPPVKAVVIQHTATHECLSDSECVKIAKSIRHYHIDKLNFDDIGTSFLVGGNGKVYEGAGWKHVGAHTRGFNKISIGIAFIGDYRDKLPTTEALNAVKDLLKCGIEKQFLHDKYHLVGHKQLSNTMSPGHALQKEIESWTNWLSNPKDILS